MSKVLLLRVGLAGAAESVRAVIDCGFSLSTCVHEQGEAQMFVYTFIHCHVCSAEDGEELEERLHGIEERLGTRLLWHIA